jgi:uncharacterized protein with beta-barrel porin domain
VSTKSKADCSSRKKCALIILLASAASVTAAPARADVIPGGNYSSLTELSLSDITQSGAVIVSGPTSLIALDSYITLTDPGNDFQGSVSLTGGTVAIVDSNGLILADLSISGTLDISTKGAITQAGPLDAFSDATFNAGTGAITLTNPGNDFRHAVSLAGGTVAIVDKNALSLGTLATGDLTATSTGDLNLGSGAVGGSLSANSNGGAITQTGPLTVTGTSTIDAGSGAAITLNDTNNDFLGPVLINALAAQAGDVQLTDKNALTLSAVFADSLIVKSSGSLDLGFGSIQGDMQATSNGGAITQSGLLSVIGSSSFDAGSGAITLTNASNTFNGAVSLTGGTVQITNSAAWLTLGNLKTGALTATITGDLNLGLGTVGGNLSANSNGGAVTQAGALTVTGTSTINAGAGAITLTNPGNDFQGAVSLAGSDVSVQDANNLTIGTINNSGSVSLIAGGTLDGFLSINTGTASLTLASNGGSLSTLFSLSGGDIALTGRDGITIGQDVSATRNFAATSSGGAITQSGGALTVGGTSTIDAGTGAITLLSANDFAGPVSLTGGTVAIVDQNALSFGILSTGSLTATSTGDLSLGSGRVGGNLFANSNGGAITQTGPLTVTGTSTIDAGSGAAITLTDTNNDFLGPMSIVGGDVQLTDKNALMLDVLAANSLIVKSSGSLDLRTGLIFGDMQASSNGGAITQSGPLHVIGSSSFDAGSGAITLTNASNTFNGVVSLTGGTVQITTSANLVRPLTLGTLKTGALTVTRTGDVNLGLGTVSGNLTVNSNGGTITQTDALTVGGTSAIDAGTGAITLTSTGNDFSGAVSLTGGTVAIVDQNALSLGTLGTGSLAAISTGDLNLGSGTVDGDLSANSHGGAITQRGAIAVTGNTLLNTSGNITLTDANNDFGGPVAINVLTGSSGAVQLTDSNALTLSGFIAGSLVVKSSGSLNLGTGLISGDMQASSNGGAITQSGPLKVGLNSSFNAGTGSITLANAGNDFTGAVSLTGGASAIVDKNALSLGTLSTGSLTATSTGDLNLGSGTVDGNLSAGSNGGAITQTDALAVSGSSSINAGTGAITLANAGNDFQGPVSLTGGASAIVDKNALSLGTLGTGSLTATSTGALGLGSGAVGGDLSAKSNGGAITQTGSLAVSGSSTINAGTGSITLTSTGNNFTGPVSLTGGTVTIQGNRLSLGTLDTGSLTATSSFGIGLGSGLVDGNLRAITANVGISQSGPLTVTGDSLIIAGGPVTLTSLDNDFQGSVSLASAGLAQITDKNSLSLGTLNVFALTANSTGDLNLGSGTVFSDLSATSNGGAITQSGPLTVGGVSTVDAGTGAITLTDPANDFQDAVSLTGGAVQVADSNDLLIASLTPTGSGPISLQAGGTLILSAQSIDAGTGDLTLASNGGVLTAPGALSGANIALTGRDRIVIDHDLTAANQLSFASSQGGITQDPAASVIAAQTLTGSALGNVSLTGANRIAELGDFTAADFSLTNTTALNLTGTLTGSNVTFDDGARVTVTGRVDALQTVMAGGRLTVGVGGVGSLTGGLQINGGASLGGTGTVGTTHVLSGGTISQQVPSLPAGFIGTAAVAQSVPATLNVAGDLVLDSGSTYVVNASGASSDLLAVSGTATIAPGAVMVFSPQGTLVVGDGYTVLTAAAGVSGTFDFNFAATSAFLGFTDVYTANSVRIELAQLRTFASAALAPNQRATASALDSVAGGSPLVSALQQLPGDSSARAAFDLLSGEIHPAMQAVQVEDSRIPRDAVLQRLSGPGSRRGAWVQSVGNWGNTDGRSGATANIDRDTAGIVGGIDTAIGDSARVGLAGGFTSTEVKMPDRLSSGTVDSYHVLGYFGVRSHGFGLRAGLGYSSNDISARRSVTFPGFTDSLRSTRDGHTVQAFGEIGYRVPLRSLTVEPIASVTQVWSHAGKFTEAGGSAALSGESESLNFTTTVAGLRLATAHAGPFRLSGLLGWKHRFGDRTPSGRLAFQSGAPFDITAAGLAKDAAIVDAEASLTVSRGVSLAAAYRGEFGDRSEDNMVRGTLTIDF